MNKRVLNRMYHAVIFTGLLCLAAAYVACGVFVLTQVEAPHPSVIPTFLWVTVFATMFLGGISGSFYCILRVLDELHYDQSHARRITGKRQGPALKKYSVAWRSQQGR